jgi:diguanylate cyclase (GGDEF)-like protein/PAS domain S-box-containing protein
MSTQHPPPSTPPLAGSASAATPWPTSARNALQVLGIAGAAILACVWYWVSLLDTQKAELQQARQHSEQHVAQLGEALSQQLEATLHSIDAALLQLRTAYLRRPQDFDQEAQALRASFPAGMLQFVTVFDADGYMRYSSNASKEHIFIGDREHFREHATSGEDHLLVSKPMRGRLEGAPIVVLSRPIREGGRFRGVIGLPLRLDYLSDQLALLRADPADRIAIVRLDGVIIARSHGLDKALKTRVPADRPFLQPRAPLRGLFRGLSPVDGVPLLYAWRRLSSVPLVAVGAVNESADLALIAQGQSRERERTLLAMTLVIGFSVSVSWLVLRLQRNNDALRRSEARNRLFLRTASDGVHILDASGGVVEASDSFCTMLGYSREEVLQMNAAQWDGLLSGAAHRAKIDGLLNSGLRTYRTRHVRKDQSSYEAEIHADRFQLDGTPHLFCSARDITERVAFEEQLRQAASVFSHAHDGIMICDGAERILDVNPAFTRMTGFTRAEAIGQTPRILQSRLQTPAFYQSMWDAIRADGHWEGEVWNRRKDGEVYAEWLSISRIADAAGAIHRLIGVFSDITAVKTQQEKLERLAHFDALTQLPNRVLLADRMAQSMAASRRSGTQLAVCYLDLDGFKPVNDSHGHEAGDLALKEVARRLAGAMPSPDTVARIGGDEFVVLVTGIHGAPDYLSAIERISAAVSAEIEMGAQSFSLSASIGVTLFPQDGGDPDTLLRHADQAMYIAKQAGRNRFHLFDARHDERARARQERLDAISRGLAEGQFLLFYQPRVDMLRGTVLGFEALIRWQHPHRGLLPPAQFLPEIENTELELQLGRWVIGEGLRQLDRWRSLGISHALSLNIAAPHMLMPGFAAELSACLQRYPRIEPQSVELEILETVALNDLEQASAAFRECRALGVQIALDDFGTGYSSLSYLRRLPVDTLKIDQSFVRTLGDGEEDVAIVQSIVGLARAFRCAVVAEGVEFPEVGAQLIAMGCNVGQGYAIARPMPAAEVPGWLSAFRPSPAWAVAWAIPEGSSATLP